MVGNLYNLTLNPKNSTFSKVSEIPQDSIEEFPKR